MKKLAIITGTGRGLGKSLALSLINQGYTVFGYSRTNKISSTFFHFNKIDLGDPFQVKKIKLPCFDKDLEEVVLINNAATIGKILPITLKSQDDIIYEYNLNTWDICAGTLIASEAGCTVSDWNGKTFHKDGSRILCTNSKIHGSMMKVLTKPEYKIYFNLS